MWLLIFLAVCLILGIAISIFLWSIHPVLGLFSVGFTFLILRGGKRYIEG